MYSYILAHTDVKDCLYVSHLRQLSTMDHCSVSSVVINVEKNK